MVSNCLTHLPTLPIIADYCRWISGAGDPRTKLHLVMGKSDPGNSNPYNQQSVVIVPADAPGVNVVRPMQVFGYDDAPEGHCEIIYDNVRVPLDNLVLGWGKGFEVIVIRPFLFPDQFICMLLRSPRSSKVVLGELPRLHFYPRVYDLIFFVDLVVFTIACDQSVPPKWLLTS